MARPERACDYLVIPTRDDDKRERTRTSRVGRHRGAEGAENFSGGFHALGELAYRGAQVSASIIDLSSRAQLVSIDDRIALLALISSGKVGQLAGYGVLVTGLGALVFSVWLHMKEAEIFHPNIRGVPTKISPAAPVTPAKPAHAPVPAASPTPAPATPTAPAQPQQ